MNRFLKHWCLTGRGEAFHAHVISYADDFVILSRGHAEEAMAWTKAVMTKLGLALTETKTSVKDARRDSFDFLGYTLRPRHFPNVGRWYLGATPSTAPINIARLLAGSEPSIGAIGRSKAIAIMPKIRLLASARPKLAMFHFPYPYTRCRMDGDMNTPSSIRLENGVEPGRLWNLWDMMQLHAGPFLDALNHMSRMAQLLGWMRAKGQTPEITLSAFLEFKDHAEKFCETCEKLQLVLTTISANALVNACAEVAISANETIIKLDLSNLLLIKARVDDICGRIKDEMGLRLLLVIPAHNASNYEQLKPLFGEEVSNKFPSIQFDLSESGKCLALGRGTAVVFHLMRMVEVGLGAVHSCFGFQVTLTGNDRNWGNILNRIRTEINSRGKNWAEKDQFQEIFALLNATKDAWRNPTMHIEKKYTEEEAEMIFFAVSSLMKRLASRMDENGLPLA